MGDPQMFCLQSSNWEPTFKNSCQPRFVQVVRHGTSVWRRKKEKCLREAANTLLWVIGIMTSVMGVYLDKGNLEYISVIKGKFVQKQLYIFFYGGFKQLSFKILWIMSPLIQFILQSIFFFKGRQYFAIARSFLRADGKIQAHWFRRWNRKRHEFKVKTREECDGRNIFHIPCSSYNQLWPTKRLFKEVWR